MSCHWCGQSHMEAATKEASVHWTGQASGTGRTDLDAANGTWCESSLPVASRKCKEFLSNGILACPVMSPLNGQFS